MKNYLIAIAFFLCLAFAGKSQNQCHIKLPFGINACGLASLVYTNNVRFDVGTICEGDHAFSTGTYETAYIILNGTPCYPDRVTPVQLGATTVEVRQIATAEGPRYIAE